MNNLRLRPRSGFTLVEVMLTMLIMAGIMVAITQILTATRRSRDTIHNIQERLLAGPAILDRMEEDLRSLFIFDRDQRWYLRVEDRVLSGFDADRLDFVCSTDSLLPYREHEGMDFSRADFNEVGYCLRHNPNSDDFLEFYRREDFGVDEEPFAGGSYAFLHDRVKAFDVKVYDEDGPEAEPLDSWGVNEDDEEIGLPKRLEIELTIELRPRLVREQLVQDRRSMVYRRVFRIPEALIVAQDVRPIPVIPQIQAPVPTTGGGPGGVDAGADMGGGGAGGVFGDGDLGDGTTIFTTGDGILMRKTPFAPFSHGKSFPLSTRTIQWSLTK